MAKEDSDRQHKEWAKQRLAELDRRIDKEQHGHRTADQESEAKRLKEIVEGK